MTQIVTMGERQAWLATEMRGAGAAEKNCLTTKFTKGTKRGRP